MTHLQLKIIYAIGSFPESAEIPYFYSLKHLLDKIYKHVGMGCFPDWPTLAEKDVEEFIKILIRHKNANIYMAFGCQEKNLSYRSEKEQ